MSRAAKLKHELKAVGFATLYFGAWLSALVMIKALVLAEYGIAFSHWSVALVGALILSKVVLVLERVPLGAWSRTEPAWMDVAARTMLYSVGVVVVLLLEKGFEGREEHGGFVAALQATFGHVDRYHIWANTLCVSGALLGYNVQAVVRRNLEPGRLTRMFLTPLPVDSEANRQTGS